MGQSIDRLRFACIDCATVIETQDDIDAETCSNRPTSTKRQLSHEISLKNINGLECSLANTESVHSQSSLVNYNIRKNQKDFEVRLYKCDDNASNRKIGYRKSLTNLALSNNSESDSNRRDTVNLHTLPTSIKYRSRYSNGSKVSVNLVNKVRGPTNSFDNVAY